MRQVLAENGDLSFEMMRLVAQRLCHVVGLQPLSTATAKFLQSFGMVLKSQLWSH